VIRVLEKEEKEKKSVPDSRVDEICDRVVAIGKPLSQFPERGPGGLELIIPIIQYNTVRSMASSETRNERNSGGGSDALLCLCLFRKML